MVSLDQKACFDALCFIEQCLPTREIPLQHLAVACDINSRSDLRIMLEYLKEQRIVSHYPSYDTWARNDSYDCSEIIGRFEVAKWATKDRIRQRSEEILSREVFDDLWLNPVTDRNSGKSESKSLEAKTGLPRKHQVKVLLNDIELRYLESLIGVVGDDKSSIFRNLLHASFQADVRNNCGVEQDQYADETEATRSLGNDAEPEYLEADIRKALADWSELSREASDEAWTHIKHVLQFPISFRKYFKKGIGLNDISIFCGNEKEGDLEVAIKEAARRQGDCIIAISADESLVKLRRSMDEHLKGIRLVYDGVIESVCEATTASYMVYEFKRGK